MFNTTYGSNVNWSRFNQRLLNLRHSVNNPRQFASLSVIPVVIEEFTDGQDDQEGEDATDDLENQLSLFCFL